MTSSDKPHTQRASERTPPSAKAPNASTEKTDAIALLQQDHREVAKLFAAFEDLNDNAKKKALAAKICLALKVHAQIEEELFYPAAREETKDNDLLDEALVEHAGAKTLIAEIEAMQPGQDLYDAKVKVLSEQIRHHVKEEDEKLFPEVRATDIDLHELGRRMAQRKAELMAELAPKKAPQTH